MSKHQEKFNLQLSLIESMKVCRKAVKSLGWLVLERSGTHLLCKSRMTLGNSAVKINISLSKTPSSTVVILKGSIWLGWGPIQMRNLKGEIGNLWNSIELAVDEI
jgi:hypothetical protein